MVCGEGITDIACERYDELRIQTLRSENRPGAVVQFTITNLGMFGVDGFTPLVLPSQAAILGIGRISDRLVVLNGEGVVRQMCTLSLAFDHRVVDGVPAAAFLARLGAWNAMPAQSQTPSRG